jgi:YjbE family integral membrane protein
MLAMLQTAQFWGDVVKILVIDLLLSGDNAVVIALACRDLPHTQRKQAIVFGVGCAIGLRIALTFFAASLLALPYLKAAGAILLLWIGVKLLLPEDAHGAGDIKTNQHLWGAIKTIIVADFVMSLDNVVGVAAAAHGNLLLLVFGLLASVSLVAMSSHWLLQLINRYPIIIYAGAGLLGYVSGEMLQSDAALGQMPHTVSRLLPALCAALVVALGAGLAARRKAEKRTSAPSNETQ